VAADGARGFYNFDLIGSTRELTDGAGAVLNRYGYDAFGETRLRQEAVPNPFTYVGRAGVMTGPAGLLNMRRRDYDPVHGRFTTRDPIGLAGDLNLYRYAFNAPTLMVDPTGELVPLLLGTALLAGAGTLIYHGLYENMQIGHMQRMVNPDNVNAQLRQNAIRESKMAELRRKGSELVANAAEKIRGLPTSSEGLWKAFWKFVGQNLEPAWNSIQSLLQQIAQSLDPNEIVGPAGYGPANHLRGDGSFAYRLNFENDRKATAPAQVVEIANAIPAGLDLASLELTSVGFGDLVIPIPPGSQRFEHSQTVTFQDTTFEVLIEISVTAETRELRAKFSSVMPDTGLPPPVEIGFLPPEDDTGRGMGHISYLARPLPALPTGTEIRNIGFVTFDRLAGGPTYRTDLSDLHDPNSAPSPARQALVTIDADAPASRVTALPAETAADNFIVNWSGTDRGAGIVSYDVYVQTDGGAWTIWRKGTPDTSAPWRGQYGRRYGFHSVATDGAGFSETAPVPGSPAQAQTLTTRPLWLNPWLWGALATLLALTVAGLWQKSARSRTAH
jgi:RHS repeat-associated protein